MFLCNKTKKMDFLSYWKPLRSLERSLGTKKKKRIHGNKMIYCTSAHIRKVSKQNNWLYEHKTNKYL